MSPRLVFLKLGGSLITVKAQPHTPRMDVLARLAGEIAEARSQDQGLQIILGHGAGSFGHVPASKYHTRQGIHSTEEWLGFAEVWQEASELNRLVMQSLEQAGLPVMVFSPSATVISRDGKVAIWNLIPLRSSLEEGQLPVVYGDVVFDLMRGGTILSTEDLFSYLVPIFRPVLLLEAGIEPGVWQDYPTNTRLLREITPQSFPIIQASVKGSATTDVTGGMLDKVHQVLTMVERVPGLNASIFSAEPPGSLLRALLGENMGTLLHG
ncbi:MAG: isopentenyl phosphate kinase family protein [Anaerolineae bacterium]|nr:isopentenyl phosphate kinase family protein [Anaerolineae bacterium]